MQPEACAPRDPSETPSVILAIVVIVIVIIVVIVIVIVINGNSTSNSNDENTNDNGYFPEGRKLLLRAHVPTPHPLRDLGIHYRGVQWEGGAVDWDKFIVN